MKYSILIADDEELIRKGFIARLEYLDIHPQSIYEAANGCAALKIIKEFRPEIVVTDIRMPDMDGLELISQVRALNLAVEFIVLSGYAEFSYAEQAIRMGVKAYLLKPISNKDLGTVLEDVKQKLDESKEIKKIIIDKNKMQKSSQEWDMEKKLNAIFHNNEKSEKKEVILGEKKYLTAIINIDGSTYEGAHFYYQDNQLIKFSINNIFEEIQISGKKVIVNNLANLNQLIAVLTGDSEKHLRQEAYRFFTKLENTLYNQLSISLTIGIGSIRDAISKSGYKEAGEAFLQRMISGVGNIYFYEDIKTLSNQRFPISELEMLSRYIERGDVSNIEILLEDIFSKDRIKQSSADYIRIVWIRIINILLKASDKIYEEPNGELDRSVLNFDVIDHFSEVSELILYLYTLIVDFIQPDHLMDMKCRNKIKLAVQYIEDNYFYDLSINDLAYQYAMSPNYFSTSFKKETNMTIVNYIKTLRLKKACELLGQTQRSVNSISQTVGYRDSQYFFRVFKKEMGITPLQYRKDYS